MVQVEGHRSWHGNGSSSSLLSCKTASQLSTLICHTILPNKNVTKNFVILKLLGLGGEFRITNNI